ncbi:hypothetical protein ACQKOE_09795 [Novosphingobium sp. NPDC080210]
MQTQSPITPPRSLELLRRFIVWGCAAAVIAAGPALPALGL